MKRAGETFGFVLVNHSSLAIKRHRDAFIVAFTRSPRSIRESVQFSFYLTYFESHKFINVINYLYIYIFLNKYLIYYIYIFTLEDCLINVYTAVRIFYLVFILGNKIFQLLHNCWFIRDLDENDELILHSIYKIKYIDIKE